MRAGIEFRPFFSQLKVIRTVPGFGEIVLVEEISLVDMREKEHSPAMHRLAVFGGREARRKSSMFIQIILQCYSDLLKVISAHNTPCSFTGIADIRQNNAQEKKQYRPHNTGIDDRSVP